MFKKIILSLVLVSSFALADETAEADTRYSIAFHPVGTIVNYASLGVFNFWMTFEAGVSDNVSVVARPVFFTGKYESASIHGLGIAAGTRFFIKCDGRLFKTDGNRRGWYVEPEIEYVYGTGSREIDYCSLWGGCKNETVHASAHGFGVILLAGYKMQWGSFIAGFDAGLGYMKIFASGSDDVHATGNPADGLAYDTNLYVGFAF